MLMRSIEVEVCVQTSCARMNTLVVIVVRPDTVVLFNCDTKNNYNNTYSRYVP